MNIRNLPLIFLVLSVAFGAMAADSLKTYQCTLLDKDGKAIIPPDSPFPQTNLLTTRSEEEAKSKVMERAKTEEPSAKSGKCWVASSND
mgnify:CR=1 FL=1